MLTQSEQEEQNVLIVEDDKGVAELFSHRINDEYEAEITHNAAEALTRLDNTIDYVLLDRRLPGMSGDEILEYISKNNIDVSVIMISAVDPDKNVVGHGYDAYLTKTLEEGEIKQAIEKVEKKNRVTEILNQYIKTTETVIQVKNDINTVEIDDERDLEDFEEELERLSEEFTNLVSELGDHRLTDIFLDVEMDDIEEVRNE